MNQYPAWKYLLVLFILVTGIIYALPNLYGEDPALQVTPARGFEIPPDLQKTIESPEIRNRLLTDGAEPAAGTPKQFQEFLASEMTRAREIIQRAGVQP